MKCSVLLGVKTSCKSIFNKMWGFFEELRLCFHLHVSLNKQASTESPEKKYYSFRELAEAVSTMWRFVCLFFSICGTELWQVNKTLELMFVLINFHYHPFREQIVGPFCLSSLPRGKLFAIFVTARVPRGLCMHRRWRDLFPVSVGWLWFTSLCLFARWPRVFIV